jgi:hypothetical protein
VANIDRLVILWTNWDRAPSTDFRVNQLEDEVQVVATGTGTAGSALREKIVVGRRSGLSVQDAVEAAVNG